MRLTGILSEVGRRLAAARSEAGLTVAELAVRAGVSSRYLRMAEAGEANLSLLKLAALAATLRVPLRELCDLDVAAAPTWRIALLGLRGAGKTSVGRCLAQRLEVPFFELDGLIEKRAGMGLGQIFDIHGEGYYRVLQREALEAWLGQHGSGVLASGGSIVNDEPSFRRLCETCRTVWLQATPEEHWQRVVAQGDLRPMESESAPRAMNQLRALLDQRTPRYERADLTLGTSARAPAGIAEEIARWAAD